MFNYIKSENRPFNVQMVADMLAQFGVKKPQVQRAVDALAESGKITCKVWRQSDIVFLVSNLGNSWTCASLQEFGKSKIYMPLQDDIELPDKGVSIHCSPVDNHKS